MKMYSAHVEVDLRDQEPTDDTMDALAPFHPALSVSPRGWLDAQISLPAENLPQAAAAALAVVEAAFGAAAIACEVMLETEFDAREGWETVPELVSVTEAAELLGVTRQAVLDRIGRRTLPATKIGRDYAIPRTAVKA